MEKIKFDKLVNIHKPKEHKIKNIVLSFFIGGLIGVIGQFLIDFYAYVLEIPSKDATTYMIVTLIFIACLCTALGFFDNCVNFAKSGLLIPITGFAHAMMSAAMEFKKEGPVFGIGSNIFKLAGSVILYGVVSAWFFGIIRYLLMGG